MVALYYAARDLEETKKVTIDELVAKYNYKPLPASLSLVQLKLYQETLPQWCKIDGDTCTIYAGSLPIATGYDRIVIGDYGAYIEIPPRMMIIDNIQIKPGEGYRFQERYKNVKYYWLCPITTENVKIYWQKNTVKYADYLPERFYISPYEVNNIGN